MYLLSVIWNVSINQSVFLAERCAHWNVTIDTNPTEFRNFGLSLQYGLSAGKGGEYTHCRPDMSPRHRSYTAAVEKKQLKRNYMVRWSVRFNEPRKICSVGASIFKKQTIWKPHLRKYSQISVLCVSIHIAQIICHLCLVLLKRASEVYSL